MYLSTLSIFRSAFMVIINAFKKLRSALMSLTSAGKNGKNVFISGIGIRGRLIRNNRQPHVTYLSVQPHQSTRTPSSSG